MSWIGLKSQALGRCSTCLATAGSIPSLRTANLLLRPVSARYASGTAKSRTKATAAEVVPIPKKKISTKSSQTTATPSAKSPRKKKSDAPSEDDVLSPPASAIKKSTRSVSTKTTAPSAKKVDLPPPLSKPSATTFKAATPPPKTPVVSKARPVPATSTVTPVSKAPAATQSPSTTKPVFAAKTPPSPQPLTPPPRQVSRPEAHSAPVQISTTVPPTPAFAKPSATCQPSQVESLSASTVKPIDPASPAYKRASRRYISVMIALPIFLVTSYFLYDRLILGHEVKSLDDFRRSTKEKADQIRVMVSGEK